LEETMLKTRFVALVHAAILAAACGSSGPATNFSATLSAANEVPANTSTATGSATFALSGTTVTYTVTYSGLSGAPIASHIHVGATGASGGVVVPFTIPTGATASGSFTGSFTQADIKPMTSPVIVNTLDDLLVQMRAGNTYTNIHTQAHTGGEIRGQNQAM
jgi:Cu/Zn superoxide dismutase